MIHDLPGKQENKSMLPVNKPDFAGQGSANTRRTSNVITYVTTVLTSTALGVTNGTTKYFRLNGVSLTGAAVFYVIEYAIYQGSVLPANLIWPLNTASSIVPTTYTMYPMGFSYVQFDDPTQIYPQEQMEWIAPITNVSAGTVDLIAKFKIRYVQNKG